MARWLKLVKRFSFIWLNPITLLIPQEKSMYFREFDAGPKSTGNRCRLQAMHSNTSRSGLLSNEPFFISFKGLLLIDNSFRLWYRHKLLLSITIMLLWFREIVVTATSRSWGTDVRLLWYRLIFKPLSPTNHWLHSRTAAHEMTLLITFIW